MKDFYVYVYYIDGIPRYVGKGHGPRATDHLVEAKHLNTIRAMGQKRVAYRFHNELASAVRKGKRIDIVYEAKNLSEKSALEIEVFLITMVYGRIRVEKDGTLYNTMDGGNGITSEVAKRFWADPEFAEKVRLATIVGLNQPHVIEQLREGSKQMWAKWKESGKDEEIKEKMRRSWANKSPESMAEKSLKQKAYYRSLGPEGLKEHARISKAGWSEDTVKNWSQIHQTKWDNMSAEKRKQRAENIRIGHAKRREDPVKVAKTRELKVEVNKNRWANYTPEQYAAHCAAMKAGWAKRNNGIGCKSHDD